MYLLSDQPARKRQKRSNMKNGKKNIGSNVNVVIRTNFAFGQSFSAKVVQFQAVLSY